MNSSSAFLDGFDFTCGDSKEESSEANCLAIVEGIILKCSFLFSLFIDLEHKIIYKRV
jgi:hypothetical protein